MSSRKKEADDLLPKGITLKPWKHFGIKENPEKMVHLYLELIYVLIYVYLCICLKEV